MNDKNELQVIESTGVAITPMQVIQQAVAQGADVEKIGQLMALQERWEANEAKKAFSAALTAFKAAGITVGKNKKVVFGATKYSHATLDNVCDKIGEELSKHGLSFRWNTSQTDGKVKVSCVLMHSLGHSETVSLESAPDTSGSKNSIQAIGSAVSYLQRYTLLAITGTATGEIDDDGKALNEKPLAKTKPLYPEKNEEPEIVDVENQDADPTGFITADQCTYIGDLLSKYPKVKAAIATKYGSIAKIPADAYHTAVDWIETNTGASK